MAASVFEGATWHMYLPKDSQANILKAEFEEKKRPVTGYGG